MPKRHPIRPHLLAWRLRLKLTQQDVAEMVGVSHSTIQRQEAGLSGVDDKTFSEIARVYGITLAELSASPDDAGRGKALHRLWTVAQSMDADGLAALATLAERLNLKS
jgi:transcriptional regulator with XRE-family HTH domain